MARQRGNRWQGDILVNGQRLRRSFGTREEAETWEAQTTTQVGEGLQRPAPTLLGPFVEEYFDYLWGEAKSRQSMWLKCRLLVAALGADTPLASIDAQRITSFILGEKRRGSANATINRKLACLSKLLKLALRFRLIRDLPVMDKMTEGKGRDRFLTPEEEFKVLAWFDHMGLIEDKLFVQTLIYTGARTGELRKLRWKDVDFKRGLVTFWVTKGGSARTVPITTGKPLPSYHALAALRELFPEAPQNAPCFTLNENTFRGHWERMRGDLGFADDPQFVPHMLRHTCASRLVQGGTDLTRVKAWMGHKAIQTTLRYAHLAPHDLANVTFAHAAE